MLVLHLEHKKQKKNTGSMKNALDQHENAVVDILAGQTSLNSRSLSKVGQKEFPNLEVPYWRQSQNGGGCPEARKQPELEHMQGTQL